MRPEEIRALGTLAGEAATGIADQARGVHAAIADRVFGALDAAGLPVGPARVTHDAIAAVSQDAARLLTGVIVHGGALAAAAGWGAWRPDVLPLGSGARGRVLLGALGGAFGDRLAASGSPLHTPLQLFVDDSRGATDRLAVFVHGLGETEAAWRLHARRVTPYGDRLAAESGVTPVYVRYNSGLPIAASGEQLAAALDALVESWPAPDAEISLIGHSMGGLVARAACHAEGQARWRDRVRRTIFLGSPHTGAPLARAARAAEGALSRLPETRPFAAPLRTRSAAVRDLADGLQAPFMESADHFFVSASVSRDPGALSGRLLGDLLVLRRSAWAQDSRTERLTFDPSHYRHLGGSHHFDLLGHPAISDLIAGWVAGDAPRQLLGRRFSVS
jgi:pimeloyl-ACP methyl ester carboxylesterase